MTNRKDAGGLKLMTVLEAVGGSEPGPSGQWRSSRQTAARPAIIEVEESAEEMDGGEEKGEFSPRHRNIT